MHRSEDNAITGPGGTSGNGHGADVTGAGVNGGAIVHVSQGTALERTVPAAAPAGPDVKRLVLESLRGRYPLVITLSLVCAGLAGAVGWRLAKPVYHSESLVRIAYTLPEVMQETDQNKPLAMFDTFMQSQRLLITSRRVIDMAIQDPIWKTTGRQVPESPDRYFAEHMKVEIQPRSEFIRIVVIDNEPGTPAAAVTAVTNAYVDLYNAQDKQLERQRLGVLEDQQSTLQSRIEQLQKQLRTGAQEFGSAKLDEFYQAAAAQVTKLDGAIADVRLAMATAPATIPGQQEKAPAADPQTPRAARVPDLSLVDQLVSYDVQLKAALDDESHRKDALEQVLAKGLGERHPAVIEARAALASARERVLARLQFQQDYHAATGRFMGEPSTPGMAAAGPSTSGKTAAQLKADEASLLRLREQAMKDLVALGNKQMDLQRLQADLDSARSELDKLTRRKEVLQAEGSLGGRLSIITSGEIPLSPDTDPRIKIGGAAAMLGFFLPLGGVVALGLMKRQYRYSDETENEIMPEIPFLGILPDLDMAGGSIERTAAAAHSVHQIRVALQSRIGGGSRVYLVTSAAAGEGKTGLTMALALSFAAAQVKTLVIDCDLVGRSLTSRLGAKDTPGLFEALQSGSMLPLRHQLTNGLDALTAGAGGAGDAYGLSAAKIRQLIAEARQYYDVVMVDSGPILGSIEATVLAREVDGVILAVSRGRKRAMVRNAIRKLDSLGGHALGFVFNRATTTDFERSPYSTSSMTSVKSGASIAAAGSGARGEEQRLRGFGPLVSAVAQAE